MVVATRNEAAVGVRQYAEAVVSGEIVAGRLVRLACQRHLNDLQTGHERGLRFDAEAAQRVIDFFGYLRLAEGQFAGQPFALQPFQQFIVGSLFGWKGPDGYRRFRKAYVEMGKGSGKSPLAAGIGLYGLTGDQEPGAEVYAAAVTRDQARIVFLDAKRMVEASPALSHRIDVNVNNLAHVGSGSFFRPVSSEARSLDGKRVHMALIDELHEHPDGLVLEKMQLGTKGRRQPLTFEITNSGYDTTSICYQHHEYTEKVLSGVIEDDGWFGYVCGLDDGDDWRDEAVWPKGNPNLGVSVTYKYLREQVREAIGMPAKQNIVKRLNFCVWTAAATRWIDQDKWDACGEAIDIKALAGRGCYAGLDLSSTTDLSALVLVFPRAIEADEPAPAPDVIDVEPTSAETVIDWTSPDAAAPQIVYDVLTHFWLPEDGLAERMKRDMVPYDVWVDQGLITLTPGDVIDYAWIKARILECAGLYGIREVAYDPWNATQLVNELTAEGVTMVPFRQGFASISAPTKELERCIRSRRLRHGTNPVLRWQANNVVVSSDPAGNVKPDKARSTKRIDGIVALIMALDRATRHESGESVYNERGLLVL